MPGFKLSSTWTKALAACPDPARARHYLGLFAAACPDGRLPELNAGQIQVVATLFGASQALSNALVSRPDWLETLDPEGLKFPRRKQGLQREVAGWLPNLVAERSFGPALARVREFKQREMLGIAARDLGRFGGATEITWELSDLADVVLGAVWQLCHSQLVERWGRPYHQDADGRWHPTAGCVLGLGKLGGQELNYSSDVDVLFAYTEEGSVFKTPPSGSTAPREILSSHQFFNRVAESFVAEVGRLAPEGMLYRIDLRLRPEGDSGPLSRSLEGYENYYAQWGQTWERMMLIKARGVAGDGSLAAEFLEMVQPFRYPRSVGGGVLREVAAMKDRIENEVVREGELERNVKLGRGGIREIEFIAQAFQVLHGGRQPFLQGAQTLPTLQKLVQYELLSAADAQTLEKAYTFLRDVEHRLQMEDNQQTHTIPTNLPAQERLARTMGFAKLKKFQAAHQENSQAVRQIFERLLKTEKAAPTAGPAFPTQFEGARPAWDQFLAGLNFRDIEKAFQVLREFVEGPGYVHVSPRTSELARQLLPRLFARCVPDGAAGSPGRLSDPDRVVTRLDAFISAYGARATLFELWNRNPSIFELLLQLFDRSEFLAELAIRTPDLVDELVASGRLRQRKSAGEILRDLRHGLRDEDQHTWLRRYHQAELMRIGLRDILGLADFEQYLTELSALADACLQYALEVVMRKNKLKSAPFAIIGLGKLGGAEIDYGSDLDLLFVASNTAKDPATMARPALAVMDLLSSRTAQGILFTTDARLRPDGEKGVLVNTLRAHEEYYRQRAMLWEIQTLTRTRPIAGDPKVGEQFQKLAADLANFHHPKSPPAAYSPDWKQKIHQMRMRIEKERTPRGQDELAIKTGQGGLMDAEFVAQALCLENGWSEPNTLRALERGRAAKALPEAEKLIANYRHLRRVEGILRRWSYEGETVLPTDPAPYYRVSARCGFASPEEFRAALAQWRAQIREVYSLVFD